MENLSDEFLCGECQEKFNSLTMFLLHKVRHVETRKPGSCPLCAMAFSRQVSLREHLHRKHNIPQLKTNTNNGKPRGRPRKEHVDAAATDAEISKAESKLTENALSLTAAAASDSDVTQQTMHIIIDKIGEGDLNASNLSDTVLHTDCSVVFPSTASTVLVETSDMSELGQLVKEVNSISQPQALQDRVQHSFQHEPSAAQSEAESSQKLCSDVNCKHSDTQEGQDTGDAVKCMESPTTDTQIHKHSRQSDTSKREEDLDFDFLFVLLTNNVKRKSFHYSRQSFKCFHCQYKTSWRRSLVKHMRESHADNLAIHQCIAVHKSEKLRDQQVMKMSEYTAVLSQQRRQMNGRRIRGVEKQDLTGYYPCTKCDKVFGRLRYLRKHQVIHKAEKKFLCDDCGKAFKTKAYLAAHRHTHQTKMYRCSQCDFTSSINALIHTHRQLHNDDSVICEVCGSAYNDRATLKKHKQVHDSSRPYPCTYSGCTWRFKTEVMCRAHFRAHTTSGRFVCNLCSYVFRHKHHLQRHLGKIHGMDEATVYRTTCSTKNAGQVKNAGVEASNSKELVQVVQEEEQPLTDTVNLIVNSGLSTEQLQSVLESGQFVIATDEADSSVNYEVANITMNVTYDTLTESEEAVSEGQTILIPHDAECSQIIFQQEPETAPASVET